MKLTSEQSTVTLSTAVDMKDDPPLLQKGTCHNTKRKKLPKKSSGNF
jgi:hypothetical protein